MEKMSKLLKSLVLSALVLFIVSPVYANLSDDKIIPATAATSITDASANKTRCRAVWVGTSQSLDFSFDGSTWVTFQGASAGSIIPVQVVGARITSGSAAPAAGDVVFLY